MSKTPLKCMFDTNVFNRILDGVISLGSFGEHIIPYATHVQRDELQNTSNEARREALMQTFHDVVVASPATKTFLMDTSRLNEAEVTENRMVHTSSAVWGTSKWGESMWSGKGSLYPVLRTELDRMEAKPNNVQDALIADTAIRGGYVLVTDDTNLEAVTKQYGGECFSVKDLKLLHQHKGGNDGTNR